MNKDKTSVNYWEDLIIAMLSVNAYSLDKTYKYRDALRDHGIFNISNLEKWGNQEIGNRLKNAGYDRGGITWIVSERLANLGKAVSTQGIDTYQRIFETRNKGKISEILLPINGIGNKVLENFFTLTQEN